MFKELIIYADESDQSGLRYGNFFGGSLIRSSDLVNVKQALQAAKSECGISSEIKWQKVSPQYCDKYKQLMDVFFDLVEQDKIKVRIMFTDNVTVPTGLSTQHKKNQYHLLYYQFLKHAFGLKHFRSPHPVSIRYYLDDLPKSREANNTFKNYIYGLQAQFSQSNLLIKKDQIAEVNSKHHDVLQFTDIVLGAMQFRLNDKHKIIPEGKKQRSKGTRAKEDLYKRIRYRINKIYPNFNIGISTGQNMNAENLWNHQYRHWCFRPSEFTIDRTQTKRR